ncbi:hypothetical protein N0427_16150 [Pseudomonas aeruginosa]|uniref:hypothetical protein n=1 Tax=Pseudomonas aeruginosa TaxID=287 RepID=UPI000A85F3EB|nr:hypothetical protein [Pseudomonas aeruginosa]MBG6699455.1 hypothetical protein [Pseudomonas aeruginosa]MBG7217880.1 hypothetical protein [Pseudomonas aeruginosa]MBG7455039.1 hypothetical protein [Pseudomonas aeruginosa]MBH3662602.1 hypothetical protein [Pseudomonas aeruginosa]MBI8781771.1 hypothetical protein [Pseudomonas aeruginosa]
MKSKTKAPSPLANFFNNASRTARSSAYACATVSAIESQRQVIEEAKIISKAPRPASS